MIDAAVLAAIAVAVDRDGDLELALAGLQRADPLLRGAARRRLRAAHADARLATSLKQGPEAERHTLRLAYLLVARALPDPTRAAGDDVAAIEAAFDAARATRPPSAQVAFWWPTALAVLALAAVGVAGVSVARAPDAAPSAVAPPVAEPPAPPVSGAFADGGVPVPTPGDAAVARALGTDAPDFLIALDRRSKAKRAGAPGPIAEAEAEMKTARDGALSPDVREALGPGAAGALEALLTAAARASEGASASDAASSDDALSEAASTLDDTLAARGLGYFVDGDVLTDTDTGSRLVLVYTFRVASVSLFAAGPTLVRALHLRRLDKLNWSHTLLGFTRPTLRWAAVLLDQLDEQVITRIAPGMEDGAAVTLFDPSAPDEDRAAVEARAGELVRAEYGALPGLDRAAAAKLGKLLGKRRALFARWEKLAAARGMTVVVPGKLRLPEGFSKSLESFVPRDDLAEMARIDAALDDRTREDAFAALRDALASSVERHEVQHRLDAAAGAQPPPMPPVLEARVGPLHDGVGKERRLAVSARAELSAYLAELARDPRTPRVGLALIARFLFDKRMHGTPESYAALTILEGLAEALAVSPRPRMLSGGSIDRRAVAAQWLAIVALPPERLREAAGKLWATLFSAPLPDLRKLAPAGARPG